MHVTIKANPMTKLARITILALALLVSGCTLSIISSPSCVAPTGGYGVCVVANARLYPMVTETPRIAPTASNSPIPTASASPTPSPTVMLDPSPTQEIVTPVFCTDQSYNATTTVNLNLRDYPDISNSRIYFAIPRNAIVEVDECISKIYETATGVRNWYYVSYEGLDSRGIRQSLTFGFVSGQYIERLDG